MADLWGPLRIKVFLFSIFKISFLKTFMPCVFLILGKLFAVCPINGTRQTTPLPTSECRVVFAVCGTRQNLYRVHIGLCRVLWPLAHGKAAVSRSHQMVGPRLFGAPVLESSAQQQLHCRRVVWSLAFRRVRFLFRPSRQKHRNGWGVLTRRCVVYKRENARDCHGFE